MITAFQATHTTSPCWFSSVFPLLQFLTFLLGCSFLSVTSRGFLILQWKVLGFVFCVTTSAVCLHLPVLVQDLDKCPQVSAFRDAEGLTDCSAKSTRATSGPCRVLPGACGDSSYLFLQIHELQTKWSSVSTKYTLSMSMFTLTPALRPPLQLSYHLEGCQSCPIPYRFLLFHQCLLGVRLPQGAFLIQLSLRTQPSGGTLSSPVLSTGFFCFSASVEDVQGDLVCFDPETSGDEGAWARAIYLGQLPFIYLVKTCGPKRSSEEHRFLTGSSNGVVRVGVPCNLPGYIKKSIPSWHSKSLSL